MSRTRNRPDWNHVYCDCVKPHDIEHANDLVQVTRHSAHLAAVALKENISSEAYHNFIAAFEELTEASK